MRPLLILFLLTGFIAGYAGKPSFPEKVLEVTVNEIGLIQIGRDTIGSDELARYIQERLFKSYMGTGAMHSKIILKKLSTEVPELVTETVQQEIAAGQKRALKEICLEKYRKLYESLDEKKQTRLKKQFPVLFQTVYS